MGAHLRPLTRPRCRTCKVRWATVAAYNTFNAHVGDFCKRCGAQQVKALAATEARAVGAYLADRDRHA